MKSEERHQLKENDLASWMQYGFPLWLKQNGSYLLLVLALCFLGYQLYNMYERKQSNTRVAAWSELLNAAQAENPPAKYQTVIDTYDIKEVKAIAYLDLGQYYLHLLLSPDQMQSLKIGKTEALEKAGNAFQKALDLFGEDKLIAGKASLGLASVAEDRGDWADARKRYQEIADKGANQVNAPFAEIAVERLKTLDDREKAPRLVALMPVTPPSSRPGTDFLPQLPGEMGSFGPPLPEAPATAPAGISPGAAEGLPGLAPAIPALPPEAATPTTPTTPATPTAAASQPK
jgi:hypothetical protein